MKYKLRYIQRDDAEKLEYAFARQGWHKPLSQFITYFAEQQRGKRKVFVAELEGDILGYVTLMSQAVSGPFKDMKIPEIADFNVLIDYRGNGIGRALLDAAEAEAAKVCDLVCLGVGMHSDYGRAQRMFALRGYVPDGSGIWYKGEILQKNEAAVNDDNLTLYMIKQLKKMRE